MKAFPHGAGTVRMVTHFGVAPQDVEIAVGALGTLVA